MSVMIQESGIGLSRKMDDADRLATEAFLVGLAGEYVTASGTEITRIESEVSEVLACLKSGILPW